MSKMGHISGFALFCEDIRNEVEGRDSLVGVFPLGVIVPELPFRVHKLGVFARLQVSRTWDQGPIHCILVLPDGIELDIGLIDQATLLSIESKTNKQQEHFGITLANVSSFDFTQEGTVSVLLRYQEERLLIAELGVELARS